MKRQILFIQGGGASAHDEWDNKLVDSLGRALGPDYSIVYPRMPSEDEPSYAQWKAAIRTEIDKLRNGALVIGHSLGGTFLINTLAEGQPPRKLGAVVLIAAPFIGEGGWPGDEFETPPDLGGKLPPGVPIHVFQGLEDETTPPLHADLYARAIPQARIYRLPGRDHQFGNDLSEVSATIGALERQNG